MTSDQSQVIRVSAGLMADGAFHGAALILVNATLMAQREAAQVRDLPQSPAFGRRGQPAPHPAPANDHQLPASDTA